MKLRIKKRVPVSYPMKLIVTGTKERNKRVSISIDTSRRILYTFRNHILISIKRYVKPITDTTTILNLKPVEPTNSICLPKPSRSSDTIDNSKWNYTTTMLKVTDITQRVGKLTLECITLTDHTLLRKLKVWSYQTSSSKENC